MAVELNHTIIHARNKAESAHFLAEILGLGKPEHFIHFLVVRLSNNVSLDFLETTDEIQTQHYAFLVSDKEFDEIFARIKSKGLTYWADPIRKQEGQINTFFGGRGCYFEDPSKNLMEIITKPYGKMP